MGYPNVDEIQYPSTEEITVNDYTIAPKRQRVVLIK
jgi:hypothetical protein